MMLTKFSVSHFKSFESKITFDLCHPGKYDFNKNVIKNGVITKGLIYGMNGSGKTNLCLAVFDITLHLTSAERLLGKYRPYINLESEYSTTEFEYEFIIDGKKIVYTYEKDKEMKLVREQFTIDGKEIIVYDFKTQKGTANLDNSSVVIESPDALNTSRVRYVANTALLDKNKPDSATLLRFIDFVNGMLLFYTLRENGYQGFSTEVERVTEGLIKRNQTQKFEKFLNDCGIPCSLREGMVMKNKDIYWYFKNTKTGVPFADIVSTGTQSLAVFYYWYIMLEKTSFVMIDEFDAYYHFELAETLVKLLKNFPDTQIFLTTHNTDLMNNDLLRPDCYFLLQDGKIDSVENASEVELEKAHNLQKMFKAGFFNE